MPRIRKPDLQLNTQQDELDQQLQQQLDQINASRLEAETALMSHAFNVLQPRIDAMLREQTKWRFLANVIPALIASDTKGYPPAFTVEAALNLWHKLQAQDAAYTATVAATENPR